MLPGADTETPYGEPIYLKPGKPIFIRGMETGARGDEKQEVVDEFLELISLEPQPGLKEMRQAVNKMAFVALVQNYGTEKAQQIADEIPLGFGRQILSILTVGTSLPNFTETGSTESPLQDLRRNVSLEDSDGL
jgi:hypothetical protein